MYHYLVNYSFKVKDLGSFKVFIKNSKINIFVYKLHFVIISLVWILKDIISK